MSNGSSNTIEVIYNKIFGSGKSSAVTNKNYEIILKKVKMYILEMEDVLFHLNSAVMMPENPEGKSSTDGNMDSSDAALKVSGLKALALAYKQIEADPNKLLIIAGHTDTSGTDEFNFKLSEERAENILYLLTVTKEEWAANCYARHKIEDYQQIMKHFEKKLACGCDPGEVDDKWGPNTKTATKNFFEKTVPEKAAALLTKVENDYQKRWPEDAWLPVYDLYSEEIAEALEISVNDLDLLRVSGVHFVDPSTPYVGCGESIPIEEKEKSNYRSQRNRRVELIFFDKDEIPEMTCPADRKKIHKEEDCPLWRKYYFIPVYLDPNDLKSVVYHLQFVYFDKIKKKQLPVPQGLAINVYEDGHKQIPSETNFKNGIYYIKVKFGKKLKDPARTKLYFEFSASDNWVFTDKEDAEPTIVVKTRTEFNNLPAIDKLKYYDLPQLWSSRNYWTRYDADINKGDRFEKVFKENLKLKPFDNGTTKPNSPLVFSLDDIVLLDIVGGTQGIKDRDHNLTPNNKDLSEKSRVKILLVDKDTGMLKLYQKTNDKKSARIPFVKTNKNGTDTWTNLIIEDVDKMTAARIVFFRDGFYTIGNKRTVVENQWDDKSFVLGARAAILNDPDYQVSFPMMYSDSEFGSTGDYDLHYFHNLHFEDKHPISYTVSYVSISFMRDCRAPADGAPIPSQADVDKFVDEGIYNAMSHWNRKRYFLEEDPVGDDKTIIRPFYFFDERETFHVTEPAGGFNIDFGNRPPAPSNHTQLFNHPNVRTAQNNAIGGRSKFLAFICRDENGHHGDAYHWAIRNEGPNHYSIFKLNKSSYTSWGDIFTGIPVTEHGDSYGANTFAHELGHSTGQPDEYVKTDYQPNPGQNWKAAAFPQYYIPYSMPTNNTSMMDENGAPRLHHLWYPTYKINESIKDNGNNLSRMLPGKKFVIRLKRDTWDIKFDRNITASGNPRVKNKLTEALHIENLYEVRNDPLKRLKLELYDTGKDEASIKYFHLNQEPTQYQAVLVIRVLLSVRFQGTWANADRALKIFQIEQAWVALGGHYRLTSGNKDFKNIYFHFLPGFSSTWEADGSCYNAEFLTNNAPASGERIPNDDGTIQVYNNVTADELARYFVNAPGASVQANDLDYLRIWVYNKIGDNMFLQSF